MDYLALAKAVRGHPLKRTQRIDNLQVKVCLRLLLPEFSEVPDRILGSEQLSQQPMWPSRKKLYKQRKPYGGLSFIKVMG